MKRIIVILLLLAALHILYSTNYCIVDACGNENPKEMGASFGTWENVADIFHFGSDLAVLDGERGFFRVPFDITIIQAEKIGDQLTLYFTDDWNTSGVHLNDKVYIVTHLKSLDEVAYTSQTYTANTPLWKLTQSSTYPFYVSEHDYYNAQNVLVTGKWLKISAGSIIAAIGSTSEITNPQISYAHAQLMATKWQENPDNYDIETWTRSFYDPLSSDFFDSSQPLFSEAPKFGPLFITSRTIGGSSDNYIHDTSVIRSFTPTISTYPEYREHPLVFGKLNINQQITKKYNFSRFDGYNENQNSNSWDQIQDPGENPYVGGILGSPTKIKFKMDYIGSDIYSYVYNLWPEQEIDFTKMYKKETDPAIIKYWWSKLTDPNKPATNYPNYRYCYILNRINKDDVDAHDHGTYINDPSTITNPHVVDRPLNTRLWSDASAATGAIPDQNKDDLPAQIGNSSLHSYYPDGNYKITVTTQDKYGANCEKEYVITVDNYLPYIKEFILTQKDIPQTPGTELQYGDPDDPLDVIYKTCYQGDSDNSISLIPGGGQQPGKMLHLNAPFSVFIRFSEEVYPQTVYINNMNSRGENQIIGEMSPQRVNQRDNGVWFKYEYWNQAPAIIDEGAISFNTHAFDSAGNLLQDPSTGSIPIRSGNSWPTSVIHDVPDCQAHNTFDNILAVNINFIYEPQVEVEWEGLTYPWTIENPDEYGIVSPTPFSADSWIHSNPHNRDGETVFDLTIDPNEGENRSETRTGHIVFNTNTSQQITLTVIQHGRKPSITFDSFPLYSSENSVTLSGQVLYNDVYSVTEVNIHSNDEMGHLFDEVTCDVDFNSETETYSWGPVSVPLRYNGYETYFSIEAVGLAITEYYTPYEISTCTYLFPVVSVSFPQIPHPNDLTFDDGDIDDQGDNPFEFYFTYKNATHIYILRQDTRENLNILAQKPIETLKALKDRNDNRVVDVINLTLSDSYSFGNPNEGHYLHTAHSFMALGENDICIYAIIDDSALNHNYFDSIISSIDEPVNVTITYKDVLDPPMIAPVGAPDNPEPFTNDQNVSIRLALNTPTNNGVYVGEYYYLTGVETLDEIPGLTNSFDGPHDEPVGFPVNSTLKVIAKAYPKSGQEIYYKESIVNPQLYKFRVGVPTVSVAEGTYYTTLNVLIGSETDGCRIAYTLGENETPVDNPNLPVYHTGTPISVDIESSCHLKIRAFKDNYEPSPMIEYDYTLVVKPITFFRISNIDPSGYTDIFDNAHRPQPETEQNINIYEGSAEFDNWLTDDQMKLDWITRARDNELITYQLGNSAPVTPSSLPQYITLAHAPSTQVTIDASNTVDTGLTPFHFSGPIVFKVAIPVFHNPNPSTDHFPYLTLTSATNGSIIKYKRTTDTEWTTYANELIYYPQPCTLQAQAFCLDMENSAIATFDYSKSTNPPNFIVQYASDCDFADITIIPVGDPADIRYQFEEFTFNANMPVFTNETCTYVTGQPVRVLRDDVTIYAVAKAENCSWSSSSHKLINEIVMRPPQISNIEEGISPIADNFDFLIQYGEVVYYQILDAYPTSVINKDTFCTKNSQGNWIAKTGIDSLHSDNDLVTITEGMRDRNNYIIYAKRRGNAFTVTGPSYYYFVSPTTTEIILNSYVWGKINTNLSGYFKITDNVIVPKQKTLVIESPYTFKFATDKSLLIMGQLNANSNSTEKIIFTSFEPCSSLPEAIQSGWGGIQVNRYYSPSYGSTSPNEQCTGKNITINGCTIENAKYIGINVYDCKCSNSQVSHNMNCNISNSLVQYCGDGGISSENTIHIEQSIIRNNNDFGICLETDGKYATISDCTIEDNVNTYSGYNQSDRFPNYMYNSSGVGIKARHGVVKVIRCTISGNVNSFSYGGGIAGLGTSELFVSNCIIKNNLTDYAGAGIYVGWGLAVILNNTIVHNRNTHFYNRDYTYHELYHEFTGAGIFQETSNALIANNLIMDNYTWEDHWVNNPHYIKIYNNLYIEPGEHYDPSNVVYLYNNDLGSRNGGLNASPYLFSGNNFFNLPHFQEPDEYLDPLWTGQIQGSSHLINAGRVDFSSIPFEENMHNRFNLLKELTYTGDRYSQRRIVGGKIDVGACEYQPTGDLTVNSQTITHDTYWMSNDIITINGDITVNSGVTLSIDANEVRFTGPYKITVYGKLICDRHLSDTPMRFVGVNTTTGWSGINFIGNANEPIVTPESDFTWDNNNFYLPNLSVLSNCTFENSVKDGSDERSSTTREERLQTSWNTCGGAIFVYQKNILIDKCEFINNSATEDGGAVYVENEPDTLDNDTGYNYYCNIRNSKFTYNHAGRDGGAIYAYNSSPFIYNNIIKNNVAGVDPDYGQGGGLCVLNGNRNAGRVLSITGNDITDNNASTNGGGIWLGMTNNISNLTNNTIAGNTADFGKELFIHATKDINLKNDIIWNSVSSEDLISVYNPPQNTLLNLTLQKSVINDNELSINAPTNCLVARTDFHAEPKFKNMNNHDFSFPSYNNYQYGGQDLTGIYYNKNLNNLVIDTDNPQIGAYLQADLTSTFLSDSTKVNPFLSMYNNNELVVNNNNLDFGDEHVGETSIESFVLKNTGTNFIRIKDIRIEYRNSTNVSSGSTRQFLPHANLENNSVLLPNSIFPSNSVAFTVDFTPDTYGVFNEACIVIEYYTSDAVTSTLKKKFNIDGKGLAPEICEFLPDLNFDAQMANNNPLIEKSKEIIIRNTGNETLTLGDNQFKGIIAPFGFCIASLEYNGYETRNDDLDNYYVKNVNRKMRIMIPKKQSESSLKPISIAKQETKTYKSKIDSPSRTDLLGDNVFYLDQVTIPVGYQVKVKICFKPYLVQQYNGDLVINSNDAMNYPDTIDETHLEIPLTGEGLPLYIMDTPTNPVNEISSMIVNPMTIVCPEVYVLNNVNVGSVLNIHKVLDVDLYPFAELGQVASPEQAAKPVIVRVNSDCAIKVETGGQIIANGASMGDVRFCKNDQLGHDWKGLEFSNTVAEQKSSLTNCIIDRYQVVARESDTKEILSQKSSRESIKDDLTTTRSSSEKDPSGESNYTTRPVPSVNGIYVSDDVLLNVSNCEINDFEKAVVINSGSKLSIAPIDSKMYLNDNVIGIDCRVNSDVKMATNAKLVYNNSTELVALYIERPDSYPELPTGAIQVAVNSVSPRIEINGGDQTLNRKWIDFNGKYKILSGITVATGICLTIENGADIEFAGLSALTINGYISAVGLLNNKITFTDFAGDNDTWKGIRFINSNPSTSSLMRYCDVSFSNNANGGGIYISDSSNLDILDCDIHNNVATTNGGGMYIYQSNINVRNSRIFTNNAVDGGGIYCYKSKAVIEGNTITNNIATNGGGVSVKYPITLRESDNNDINPETIRSVDASRTNLYTEIIRNFIQENTASNNGGGVNISGYSTTDSLRFNNNVITGNNILTGHGEGIYIAGSSKRLLIINNTFTANHGNDYELYSTSSIPTSPILVNNIIYDAAAGVNQLYMNSYSHVFYNCIYHTLNDLSTWQLFTQHNMPYSPHFVSTDNPNTINNNYTIGSLSICINYGSRSASYFKGNTDKLNNPRINQTGSFICDIGAYEYYGASIVVGQDEVNEVDYSGTRLLSYEHVDVYQDITINSAYCLSIAPGTLMDFDSNVSVTVIGKLSTIGKPERHIILTGNGTVGWRGIRFVNYQSPISFEYCDVSNGNNNESGGVISAIDIDQIRINYCTFTNNKSEQNGGAIFVKNCARNPVIITNSRFVSNIVTGSGGADFGFGGAVYLFNTDFQISGNTFSGNKTELPEGKSGGGIAIFDDDNSGSETRDVYSNSFNNNQARSCGGSVYINYAGAQIYNNRFTNNQSDGLSHKNLNQIDPYGGGGALYLVYSKSKVSNNLFTDNQSLNGGAIGCFTDQGNDRIVVIENNDIHNNCAMPNDDDGGFGGGIYIQRHQFQINNNRIQVNRSVRGGGCSVAEVNQNEKFYNNLLTDNTASTSGGALYLFNSIFTSFNNTICGNRALNANGGNGLYLEHNSRLDFFNSILWNNGQNQIVVDNSECHPICVFTDDVTIIDAPLFGEHIQFGNPLFVDYAAGNYSLQRDSHCIENGANEFYFSDINRDLDLGGRPRLAREYIDLGCYEYSEFVVDHDITENTTLNYSSLQIQGTIHVLPNVTLQICDDVTLQFVHDGMIVLDLNSTLLLGNDVTFFTNNVTPIMNLQAESGLDIVFNQTKFINALIYSKGTKVTFTDCMSTNSRFDVHDSDVNISMSEFDNSPIGLFSNANTSILRIDESSFHGIRDNCALNINGYAEFMIEGNDFYDCDGLVNLFKSGWSKVHSFKNNHIYLNVVQSPKAIGIDIYSSCVSVEGSNVIENSNVGLRACANSQYSINGTKEEPYQIIKNNLSDEIVFKSDSIPYSVELNVVYDNTFNDGYLVHCLDEGVQNPIKMYNYWGVEHPNPALFFPPNIVDLDCTWTPGNSMYVIPEPAQELYETGLGYEELQNYSLAQMYMKDVIGRFPGSKWADYAAAELLIIEKYLNRSNYDSLQRYYYSIENLNISETMNKKVSYLANYCDILMGNYPEAIQWYENILDNNPSEQDSIYAVIDIGFIYLLMEESSPTRYYKGRYENLRPRSQADYYSLRESLIKQLFNPDENTNNNNTVPLTVVLDQNFPNPFNPSTTISFTVSEKSPVCIEIFNIKGQKVRTLSNASYEKGKHSIVWDGKDNSKKDVSSGLYFYRMNVNGIIQDTKKCLLLK